MPPPFHGSTMMNKRLAESAILEKELNRSIFPLSISKNMSDIGKFSVRKFMFIIRDAFRLIYKLITHKFSLVYFAISPYGFAFFKDALYVFIVKILSRAQLIFHLHGKGMGNYASKNKLNLFIYKWVFKNSHVICLANNLISDIRPFYGKDVYIVNNGIKKEIDQWNNTKKSQVVTFLFLSNFLKEKGILDLFDAVSVLKEKEFKLLLVGEESDYTNNDLVRMIKDRGLQDHCEILGPKYGMEKWNCLKSADVFVFPTYYNKECFPVVLLEAFQAGLPVISTYEGGIPDIIDDGKNGFLIKQRDIKSLADKMDWFIEHREKCKEMGNLAREKFETTYTMEIFENNLLNILKGLLNNPN